MKDNGKSRETRPPSPDSVKRVTMRIWDIRKVCFDVNDVGAFIGTLREISTACTTHIICFDAEKIAGRAHVEAALMHAARARQEGSNISHSLEMEALLFAAGSRQCSHAMEFGVHQGVNRAYLCICPESEAAWASLNHLVHESDEDWEEIPCKKQDLLMDLFDITHEEIRVAGAERLRDLVLERVALLEVYR